MLLAPQFVVVVVIAFQHGGAWGAMCETMEICTALYGRRSGCGVGGFWKPCGGAQFSLGFAQGVAGGAHGQAGTVLKPNLPRAFIHGLSKHQTNSAGTKTIHTALSMLHGDIHFAICLELRPIFSGGPTQHTYLDLRVLSSRENLRRSVLSVQKCRYQT